jgi:hypothetical protein
LACKGAPPCGRAVLKPGWTRARFGLHSRYNLYEE